MLSPAGRVLFRRLAVFAGTCSLQSIESVCAGDSLANDEIVDVLTRLVDRSLVIAEDVDGAVRYRMLEPIRQYVLQRLVEAGEAAAWRVRRVDDCAQCRIATR